MRVCLLTTQDLDADPFPEDDWPCDPRPFLPEATWEVAVLRKATAVRTVTNLARRGFDLFFNLCDGAWDEATPGIEVVRTLERLNVPFTGGTSQFYEPPRDVMKRVCRAWGIDTPDHALVTSDEDVERAAATLRFPLFVKHASSYASIGLTRESRVETPQALRKQARKTMRAYGRALIEEYIDGDEYTVLVAENPDDPHAPTTYTPIQYRFPPGESFKHADLKWVDYDGMETVPVRDSALAARLRDVSAKFFLGLSGAGYGRCDIRGDDAGRLFMLEINVNCGLYYAPADAGGADLCLAHDGEGHEGFTRRIVQAAFRRHARRDRPWEVRVRPGGRHALQATRALRPGDPILPFDERPHRLVTRARLEGEAGEVLSPWLRRQAWPLTDQLWVALSSDPADWTPIEHSCDPSAWFDGLDIVARRALAPGDEITLEFATFHDERMPSFECECRAATCRGTIRGGDYRKAFVARYGRHVSDHVQQRRATPASVLRARRRSGSAGPR